MIKILLYILTWIGCATLYVIVISIGTHLVETKIVNFKYEFINYIYYFGLGIITWFPCDYMFNYNKTKQK